jgi:DNA-binding MarR family transcriptional regulator
MATLKLTEAHLRALAAIERAEQPTAATIAGTSKRPSIIRTLDTLERHGLIRVDAGPLLAARARDLQYFELTPAGRVALRARGL